MFGLARSGMDDSHAMWHTRSMVTCLVLETSRKQNHCHAISDVYGMITLVI